MLLVKASFFARALDPVACVYSETSLTHSLFASSDSSVVVSAAYKQQLFLPCFKKIPLDYCLYILFSVSFLLFSLEHILT